MLRFFGNKQNRKRKNFLQLLLLAGFVVMPAGVWAEEACSAPKIVSCSCQGGVKSLTLQNSVDENSVEVLGEDGAVIYSKLLNAGEIFTIYGTGKSGVLDANIYIDGEVVDTSCSSPITTGMEVGTLKIVSGESASGASLCSVEE
ncbi:MAG TPA: hypothetical protein ENK74_00470 [Nitratifractor sp.]|nr:hypothetical protein [Nitratifractor sp.]